MSDIPKAPPSEVVKCPLCEGRGEIEKRALFDRLQEKDFGRKIASYLTNVVEAERTSEALNDAPDPDFKHEVNTWNLTHFLWRRSPKE
ncbi:MAG TPA: hypothetical protein VK473_09670 [Terriglobales bacterium]|nr:hypothetical protein [Terriglobales bacterium]